VMMEVIAVVVHPHLMLMLPAKFAKSMDTLQVTAGGVIRMTMMMEIEGIRVQISHPMVLTLIGILTLVL
jgi:hypothetical protein